MDLKEKAINTSNQRHPWELARVDVIASLLKELIPDQQQPVTIFDVGCGDAFVPQELSKRFKHISFFAVDTGYDRSFIDASNLQFQNNGVPVRLFQNLKEAEAASTSNVHVVLLLDVLEHVPHDVAFLKEVAGSSKVNNETIFLITVPSFQTLFCSHDVFLEHYIRYNHHSLKERIDLAGLHSTVNGYFFVYPLALRLIRVLYEKLVPVSTANGIANWRGGRFITQLVYYSLLMDFKISSFLRKWKLKLPGLSNYAVCKKSPA
jgi:2-polyprenyl-3-methyl-5-hydroxy-6-metoxy-1,4-benzoquinol methylase